MFTECSLNVHCQMIDAYKSEGEALMRRQGELEGFIKKLRAQQKEQEYEKDKLLASTQVGSSACSIPGPNNKHDPTRSRIWTSIKYEEFHFHRQSFQLSCNTRTLHGMRKRRYSLTAQYWKLITSRPALTLVNRSP
jgi:hypothetical protein